MKEALKRTILALILIAAVMGAALLMQWASNTWVETKDKTLVIPWPWELIWQDDGKVLMELELE